MRYAVKVKPNASVTKIVSEQNNQLTISIAAPPDKNKANIELIKFLSKYFSRKVRIVSGLSSRNKIVEV